MDGSRAIHLDAKRNVVWMIDNAIIAVHINPETAAVTCSSFFYTHLVFACRSLLSTGPGAVRPKVLPFPVPLEIALQITRQRIPVLSDELVGIILHQLVYKGSRLQLRVLIIYQ
jgi:hypothetical protein